jgi:hypothetical protein
MLFFLPLIMISLCKLAAMSTIFKTYREQPLAMELLGQRIRFLDAQHKEFLDLYTQNSLIDLVKFNTTTEFNELVSTEMEFIYNGEIPIEIKDALISEFSMIFR